MAKRIDKLTKAQEAALVPHAEKWIARGLDCSPPDWGAVESGIRDCYRFTGLDWRGNVVRVPNPFVGALAFPVAGGLVDGEAVGGAVRGAVRGAVDEAVGGAVSGAVGGAVSGAVGRAVRGAVDEAVREAVDGAVREAVDEAVGGAVGRAVGGNWYRYIGGQWWQGSWRWGAAYLSFFRDHCDLDLKGDLWERLDAWERANTAGWWWPHKQFVMVCERPKFIRREQVGARGWGSHRLHCEDGPAIAWEGLELYFWHGIHVPAEAFTDPGWLNADRITREQNAELRRCFMEIYGQGRYFAEAGGELLDEVHEPPIPGLIDAKLWRLDNPDGPEPLVCVEVQNSTPEPDGSYKRYSLWVHPELRPLLPNGEMGEPQEQTALNAIASTFGERGEGYLSVGMES